MSGEQPEPDDPRQQPLPEGGWSESIETLKDAIVVPPVESAFTQEAGLLNADGSYCHQGALWRRYRPLTTEPPHPGRPLETVRGRWLWGGVLWAHFGHFLVESTSRLWALDRPEEEFEGILFIPKRPRVGDKVRTFQKDFVRLMQVEVPLRVATEPVAVEELVVPGQGFGLGTLIQGTRAFRSAIHRRFAAEIVPDGPEKIYLSRSALGLGKGGMLGEERLEEFLAAEGFEIFHPQDHDLGTQLARYKAATHVVAADGSALHLFAMVGRPHQRVAMIHRRKSTANNLLAENVARFCETDPLCIDALRSEWVRAGKGKSNRQSFGELNHEAIGRALAGAGFIRPGVAWPALNETQRRELLVDKGLDARGDFVESPQFERQRIRELRQDRRAARTAAKENRA